MQTQSFIRQHRIIVITVIIIIIIIVIIAIYRSISS